MEPALPPQDHQEDLFDEVYRQARGNVGKIRPDDVFLLSEPSSWMSPVPPTVPPTPQHDMRTAGGYGALLLSNQALPNIRFAPHGNGANLPSSPFKGGSGDTQGFPWHNIPSHWEILDRDGQWWPSRLHSQEPQSKNRFRILPPLVRSFVMGVISSSTASARNW